MTREIYTPSAAPAAIAALVAVGTRPGTARVVVECFLDGEENAPTAAQAALIRPLLVRLETAAEAASREAASAAHDAAMAATRAAAAEAAVAQAAVRAAAAEVDGARGGMGIVADIYRLAPHLCSASYSSGSRPGDDRTDLEGNQVWEVATPNIRAADDTYAREVWARVGRGARVVDVIAEMGPDPAREAVKASRAAEAAEGARVDRVEGRIAHLGLTSTEDAAVELDGYAADATLPHWVSSRAARAASTVRKNAEYNAAHAAEVARMEAVYAARREAKAARRGAPATVAPATVVNLNDPWAALGNIKI